MQSESEKVQTAVYSVSETAAFKNPFITDFTVNKVGDKKFAVEFVLSHQMPNKYLFEFCEEVFNLLLDKSYLINVMLHNVDNKKLQLRLVDTGNRRLRSTQ